MGRVNFRKWLRVIHRDLGFLMVGITLIYGISGFLLNHMGEHDPAYKTEEGTLTLPLELSLTGMIEECEAVGLPVVKNIGRIDDTHFQVYMEGGIGVYNSATGIMDYETHKKRHLVYWINKLHYSRVSGWNVMADIFAFSLVFFALSGLFMVRGRRGLLGSGKWYLLLGVAIPVLYVALS